MYSWWFIYNKDFKSEKHSDGVVQSEHARGIRLTNDDKIISLSSHNHAPEPLKYENLKILEIIKERAKTTPERSVSIISKELVTISGEIFGIIPKIKPIWNTIARVHNHRMGVNSVENFHIPDILKFCAARESFFRKNTGLGILR